MSSNNTIAERCPACREYFDSRGGAETICVVCRVKRAPPRPGAEGAAEDGRAA